MQAKGFNMTKSIHVICGKGADGQPGGVYFRDGSFRSGHWDFKPANAETVEGGWLYFHETKASPSYAGGVIDGFERIAVPDLPRPLRIEFSFQPKAEAIGHEYRGQNHGPAWTGRPVEADLPHETVKERSEAHDPALDKMTGDYRDGTDTSVVVVGNLSDGYYFIGPFKNSAIACNFAERAQRAGDLPDTWTVTPLRDPEHPDTLADWP